MTRRLVVVGSGIAGLYAALLASEAAAASESDASAPGVEVVLLTKGTLEDSNTFYAQGGISAVLGPDEAAPGDTVAAHIADTLAAGAGLNDPEAVRILCTEAVRDITGLRRFGVEFDGGSAGPALGLEAAHSAARILHAGGDATGACIARGLTTAVLARAAQGRLRVETGAFVTELLTDARGLTGVAYLAGSELTRLDADAVLLATGGAGRLFARTSNPAVATADGLALAWRAGAAVRDLEFFQFHPTTLAATETAGGPPALLISEAVRGEGGVLLDADGRRFMPNYHPDADLAPRDVVSRSIALHLAATGMPADSPVYLDARTLERRRGAGFLARRFPTITARTRAAGYDWAQEPLPVSPAAHYWMGGIATDLHGRTTVPRLYAAGEAACTGVHGANRLASNSLLEGLVFGRRAVESFLGGEASHDGTAPHRGGASHDRAAPRAVSAAGGLALTPASAVLSRDSSGEGTPRTAPEVIIGSGAGAFSREALGLLMTRAAGVLRLGAELDAAAAQLAAWAAAVRPETVTDALDQSAHEDSNLLLAARLLVQAARARTGSVGAHYRADAMHSQPRPARPAEPTPAAARHAALPETQTRRHLATPRTKQRIPS
ncbi:L-aspartate oxidase [Arthrobacter sp. B3I4]|uniref:L-aspartate oxidase n=1 Tax=Arthrobacter sp. B3I4 TaxID=3042267 RepID=UPI0027849444|nr:FAD-binding protein [Arthrobacter sp. B3I4]MDQ0755917.1 L-aspartate oxidase [Arthrobacter sp. B3I4]